MSLEQTIPHSHNNNETEVPQEHISTNIPDSPSSGNEDDEKRDLSEKKTGRRKINIEFIEDKSRRHITFSKRKAGIMKKAYELSTLTGTQVLLLVASETGHVYTFATPKLQPLITKAEGKNLIQSCLNAQEPPPAPAAHVPRVAQSSYNDSSMMYSSADMRENQIDPVYEEEKKESSKGYPPLGLEVNSYPSSGPYSSSNSLMNPMYSMPSMVPSSIGRGYPSQSSAPSPYTSHAQYSPSAPGGPPTGQYSTHASNQYPSYGIPGLPPAPWSKPSASHNMQINTQSTTTGHTQQSSSLPQSKPAEHQPEHN